MNEHYNIAWELEAHPDPSPYRNRHACMRAFHRPQVIIYETLRVPRSTCTCTNLYPSEYPEPLQRARRGVQKNRETKGCPAGLHSIFLVGTADRGILRGTEQQGGTCCSLLPAALTKPAGDSLLLRGL